MAGRKRAALSLADETVHSVLFDRKHRTKPALAASTSPPPCFDNFRAKLKEQGKWSAKYGCEAEIISKQQEEERREEDQRELDSRNAIITQISGKRIIDKMVHALSGGQKNCKPPKPFAEWKKVWPRSKICDRCEAPAYDSELGCAHCNLVVHVECLTEAELALAEESGFVCDACRQNQDEDYRLYMEQKSLHWNSYAEHLAAMTIGRMLQTRLTQMRARKEVAVLRRLQNYLMRNVAQRRFMLLRGERPRIYTLKITSLRGIPGLNKSERASPAAVAERTEEAAGEEGESAAAANPEETRTYTQHESAPSSHPPKQPIPGVPPVFTSKATIYYNGRHTPLTHAQVTVWVFSSGRQEHRFTYNINRAEDCSLIVPGVAADSCLFFAVTDVALNSFKRRPSLLGTALVPLEIGVAGKRFVEGYRTTLALQPPPGLVAMPPIVARELSDYKQAPPENQVHLGIDLRPLPIAYNKAGFVNGPALGRMRMMPELQLKDQEELDKRTPWWMVLVQGHVLLYKRPTSGVPSVHLSLCHTAVVPANDRCPLLLLFPSPTSPRLFWPFDCGSRLLREEWMFAFEHWMMNKGIRDDDGGDEGVAGVDDKQQQQEVVGKDSSSELYTFSVAAACRRAVDSVPMLSAND